MTETRSQFWLETDTLRVAVREDSVLVGRSLDCDVVLLDERVSRHHALFRAVDDSVELIPLGHAPILVDDEPVAGIVRLRAGATIEIVGTRFHLRRGDDVLMESENHWFVEREPGVLVRVGADRVLVGGSVQDDVSIPGLPPRTVALELVGERLVLEVMTVDVTVEQPREVGDMITLEGGERVLHRGTSFRVLSLPADPSKTTRRPTIDEAATGLTLAFLPRGGRLAVTLGSRIRKIYLSEMRCDLLACLIQPPAPYRAGELIPDHVIAQQLWPGGGAGRVEINTLVWRVRKDLAAAGLECLQLIDRRAGGVRLIVSRGARCEIVGE